MHYWLLKSEPNVFSFDDLCTAGVSMWDGVRNYQARNNLRQMKVGDLALFYHSNIGKEVVGICKIIREYYPDPTAQTGDWSVVDVVPVQKLDVPVTLQTIKNDIFLQHIPLIRHSRLSVIPLKKEEFDRIVALGSK